MACIDKNVLIVVHSTEQREREREREMVRFITPLFIYLFIIYFILFFMLKKKRTLRAKKTMANDETSEAHSDIFTSYFLTYDKREYSKDDRYDMYDRYTRAGEG